MRPPAPSEGPRPFDPARRFRALEAAAARARERGEAYDLFDAMVESVYAVEAERFPVPAGEDAEAAAARVEAELELVRRGVTSAIASYDAPTTRVLFDACLLAGATEEQLAESFAVDPLETAAYRHLFFDRNVFPNAFHLVHYIGSLQDEHETTLLRIAQTQGFTALAVQYGLPRAVTPEEALANVLAADAAAYRRHREAPITSQSIKDIRTLGKQVVEVAKAVQKVQESKVAVMERQGASRKSAQFELIAAPPNPTLEELLASGGELATTPASSEIH